MSFTLHQLQIFAKVAEYKSMTKAAEALDMSQPSVSIQMKKLEEHMGLELFEVIGKQLYLTEAGRSLWVTQKRLSQELDHLDMTFDKLKGSTTGSLHIAAVSTAKYIMPYILGSFRKPHQDIAISMNVSNRAEVIEELRSNACDFAVFTQLPDDLELDTLEFIDHPLVLAAPPEHPLIGQSLQWEDLKDENFIYREKGSGTRMMMEKLMSKHKIPLQPVMELSTNEAVKQAIMAGIGISLISEVSLTLERELGYIAELEVCGLPLHTSWKLVHLKDKQLSPLAQTFKQFISTIQPNDILPFNNHLDHLKSKLNP